jgi:hypothetical protein
MPSTAASAALNRLEVSSRYSRVFDRRRRSLDHVVAAQDVRMREPVEQAALPLQTLPQLRIVQSVGARRLDHAAAMALGAPRVVDVEAATAMQVIEHLVAELGEALDSDWGVRDH